MRLLFFFFFFSSVAFAQNKQPLTVSFELSTNFFNQIGSLQHIQIGHFSAHPAKKMPFREPMFGLAVVLRKPVTKHLALGINTGVSMVMYDNNLRTYSDKEHIVIIPIMLDILYGFKRQWKTIKPFVNANFGYAKQHYLLVLNSETSLDHRGGLIYGIQVGFSLQNRKYKALTPFKFMVGYRNYYENVHASIHYIPSAGLENIDFDYKKLRESMSFAIQYEIPFKKKKNKKEK
jgi:hypothetical protein